MAFINLAAMLKERHFGVDEAGRGCCAGPFYVAAVEFPWEITETMRDSKKLSPVRREKLCNHIVEHARYAVCSVDAAWIDEHGIQEAQRVGLYNCIDTLHGNILDPVGYPNLVVVDGTPGGWNCHRGIAPQWEDRLKFMVKADATVAAVSAASILAKTFRDRFMAGPMHEQFPQYRFDVHKGYNTPQHLAALDEFGSCVIHRHSFANVERVDARKS